MSGPVPLCHVYVFVTWRGNIYLKFTFYRDRIGQLDDRKKERRFWYVKEEELDRNLLKIGFGRDYEPVQGRLRIE